MNFFINTSRQARYFEFKGRGAQLVQAQILKRALVFQIPLPEVEQHHFDMSPS